MANDGERDGHEEPRTKNLRTSRGSSRRSVLGVKRHSCHADSKGDGCSAELGLVTAMWRGADLMINTTYIFISISALHNAADYSMYVVATLWDRDLLMFP